MKQPTEICVKSLPLTDLNELLLQLVDGQALPLLQDGELGLLSVRGLVSSEGVLLPLWDVVGHHANASHVGCNLPAVNCERGQKCEEKLCLTLQLRSQHYEGC